MNCNATCTVPTANSTDRRRRRPDADPRRPGLPARSRLARGLLGCVLAFAAALPARAGMGYDEARTLLVRTCFGATEAEVREVAALTRAQAVERLLRSAATAPQTPPPEWVDTWTPASRIRQLPEEDRRAFQREQIQRATELRTWWMTELLATPAPFTERMTLFWHNHFVSSVQKVRAPQLMYRQNLLLRRHAVGNFAELLHAASRDPAMIVYLDGASNRRGQPNENFAREVMELFTLGEGHYTEQDVKEAARAFTGWSMDPETGTFLFRPFAHDGGVKTVFGTTGALDGGAVLDLLLARPQTAEFIVAKLWREFVSPAPDAREVKRIAARLRDSRYDLRVALRELLTADALYAPENRGTLVKSPVDLVVGTLRQFRFEYGDVLPFVAQVRTLGQDLFAPPNVKGWPGGEAWINSTTLLARKQFLERIFRVDEARPMLAAMRAPRGEAAAQPGAAARERILRAMADVRFDGARWFEPFGAGDSGAVRRLLLPLGAGNGTGEPAGGAMMQRVGIDLVRAIVQDPVYQLK